MKQGRPTAIRQPDSNPSSMNDKYPPKISVLVIAYNHEEFIRQALDSVMMQRTDERFEIVVADDCSQDSTLDIVREYQTTNPDIRIVPLQENLGITRNYQRGFSACEGKYIAVLEGDDYWILPNKLRRMASFLDQHPECVFCFHRFI